MENNKPTKVRAVSAATKRKQEEQARQKIAFNLDNYMIATEICVAILQVDSSEEVKIKANETLLATLDKIQKL